MDAAQALEILTAYRAWVMRQSRDMPDPKQIGLALDVAADRFKGSPEAEILAQFNLWRRTDYDAENMTFVDGPKCPEHVDVMRAIDHAINNWGK